MKAFWFGLMALTFVAVWQEPDYYRPPPTTDTQVFIVIRIDQPENEQARVLLRAYETFEECRAVADSIEEAAPEDHRAQWCQEVTVEKVVKRGDPQ